MQNPAQTEDPPWTILSILKWTTSYLNSHDIESPRASAEILLAHVLGLKRIDLYIRYDQPLIQDELSRLKTAIRRRMRREPVAYIVGEREFWSLSMIVTPDVLIPRPETECLVEAALKLLAPPKSADAGAGPPLRVLELGTGSGAVALALAAELRTGLIAASDRSEKALGVAVQNARRHGLDRNLLFFSGDWFSCLRPGMTPFHMILSNPPYIPSAEIDRLQAEVSRYEPRGALDGGADGLGPIRTIIGQAPDYLRPGGHLLLEIGHDQSADIERIVELSGAYAECAFIRDYGGHLRVASIRRK
ncbi:peptide chain release factor N(5)-glutamine methyltransferase [Desulfococcus sp.]|uniref:peptide chain release factor N(5)-glutamine methyltransferase n=1 Tax=Desulfococcus sp. TaxID=2025834 RepID=UPI0035948E5B